jgi:tetratricopeptide (TPR) repeat protein
VQARTAGTFPLYLGTLAALSPWGFPLLPFVAGWLAAWLAHGSPLRPYNEVQLVNVLVLLLVAASHVPVRHRDSVPRLRPGGLLLRRLGAAAGLVAFFSVCWYAQRQLEQRAGEHVRRGVEQFKAGEDAEALAQWQQAIARYPGTSNWGAAVYNSAWLHQQRQRYAQAIPYYERLLGSGLDDRDPDRYLMNPYRNYHHRASLGLSECHEALGNLPEALRYARLARDRYPYQSWCGTCLMEAVQALNERIRRLEQQWAVQP